jgi:hypothetical protein
VKRAFHLGGGVVLFLLLAGPTPGNIGGCGGTNATVSAPQHCTDQEFWICRRDEFAGRITTAEFAQCQQEIPAMCDGATWPPGCAPTPAQSQACIMLLQRQDRAHLTYQQLREMYPDCNLCQ